ncbi:molybdenum cofactor biosynthesis protein MoaE [Bathymodiolus thermophilus thioautotrophic gill symbiont]|nr:molybdenum cofactor biosynthesis protein MoaE [Bathymodiolus thermophilus thioautotrophic gill symbiont]CAB5496420.1 Molybdopterin synthase catalytic subunit MoaE (EC [Bathymodiolus thermophilus thioautotrophic gill symbiont]
MDKISVQQEDFDLSIEVNLAREEDSGIGAVVSFVGTVRDLDGKPLSKMTLEHYPKMTEKALSAIVNQAHKRWILGNITVIHRVGDLPVNAQIVLVIATSKHRKSAFEACEFVMDYLKTQAPFWKKEHTKSGSHWVQAKTTDVNQTKC